MLPIFMRKHLSAWQLRASQIYLPKQNEGEREREKKRNPELVRAAERSYVTEDFHAAIEFP